MTVLWLSFIIDQVQKETKYHATVYLRLDSAFYAWAVAKDIFDKVGTSGFRSVSSYPHKNRLGSLLRVVITAVVVISVVMRIVLEKKIIYIPH